MPDSQPSARVRIAAADDLDALFALATRAGTGLTNLPADRQALAARLASSLEALAADDWRAGPRLLLVLEADAGVVGSAMIQPRVGADWPFYSYKISRLSQTSKAIGKTVASPLLNLVNDYDDYAEVGGLFLDEAQRAPGLGRLLARSRYLFIAEHRALFGSHVLAEIRGVQADDGHSPFWEAVGRPFYGMSFEEADRLNGVQGNQFIADLGPRYPIYMSLLPPAAREAVGQPHAHSRRARELLLQEGFHYDGYVDIFDAGPTLAAAVDQLKGVRENRLSVVDEVAEIVDGADCLVASGHRETYRAARGPVEPSHLAGVVLGAETADLLGVRPGDRIRHAPF